MISPHDNSLHRSAETADDYADARVSGHQRGARNDPSMRDGDSGRGNPYETDVDEYRIDVDIGDTVPLDDESPDAGGSVRIPNAESAVVPTADTTSTGAERDAVDDIDFETDDEVTAVAEQPTVARAEPERQSKPRPEHGGSKPARADGRPADPDLPIEGYRHLTVPEIMQRVYEMPIEEARAVQRYESVHLRRKTLLVKLERYLRNK